MFTNTHTTHTTMASRRGGYKNGKHAQFHNHHHQTDEILTLKPISDHKKSQQIASDNSPSTSSSAVPSVIQESISTDKKPAQNRRNSRKGYRIRGAHVKKPQLERKSEVGFEKEEIIEEGDGSKLNLGFRNDGDEVKLENVEKGEGGNNKEFRLEEENEVVRLDEVNKVVDVGKRLEELTISHQELELSEEQVKINDQLQEDELLALEAIYGDDISILEKQNGLRSFKINIPIEVPKAITITTNLKASEGQDGDSSGFSYSFEVEHIHPVVLTCLLPKSYPSDRAPYFTITIQWLDSRRISDLCSKLDSIWEEQPQQEVIYQWVEWLNGSTLSYLGFDNEIILGPYGVRHNGDKRAIFGSVSPDADIPSIKSYNDEQRRESFFRNIHDCLICFSEFPGSEFIRLPCEHFYCYKCMETYSGMHIKEGTVMQLKCPESKCGGMIPPGLLKRLLGEDEFQRWESLMLEKTLESMSDVAYCPRCDTACLEDEDQHGQCSKCFYSFCTMCREKRHVGDSCMTPEMKLQVLQERQKSGQLGGMQRNREQAMINEMLSVKEINRIAKQCPSCKMPISKTEGCNKMVCGNCGQFFCYRCSKAISGYEHFREEGECELFPAQEIQRWEERMVWEERLNARQIVGQMQAQASPDRAHPCPLCGQLNLKVGNNNHIFCWACQNHYCYLCKKMVKRSSVHFVPKGCKQHTAD